MGGKSNYLEDKVLNWALNGVTMGTAPAAVYVALYNGDPLDTGAGGAAVTTTIRPAGRPAASFGNTPATNAGANTVANDAVVDFGVAAGGATVTHFAVFDAASGGNMLYSSPITGAPKTIIAGANVTFPIGTLIISED